MEVKSGCLRGAPRRIQSTRPPLVLVSCQRRKPSRHKMQIPVRDRFESVLIAFYIHLGRQMAEPPNELYLHALKKAEGVSLLSYPGSDLL